MDEVKEFLSELNKLQRKYGMIVTWDCHTGNTAIDADLEEGRDTDYEIKEVENDGAWIRLI